MPRWESEREHEPCPHCGRNTCSWHMPGRRCVYAYEDLPGEVKTRPPRTADTDGDKTKGLTGG